MWPTAREPCTLIGQVYGHVTRRRPLIGQIHLLYEGDGDEDPLAEEDEDAEDDEEEDPRDAGEGQPGVALLQEVIQDLRSPVQLQKCIFMVNSHYY